MNAFAVPRMDGMAIRLPSKRSWPAAILAVAVLATVLHPSAARSSTSVLAKVDPHVVQAASARGHAPLSVIVRETVPSSETAERLVARLGGRVTYELPIIGGFSASIPGRALVALVGSPSVLKVWGDGHIDMSSVWRKYAKRLPNTVWQRTIGLPKAQSLYQGTGVTVALLDTGVVPTADLGNRVLARVDFTPDHDGYDRLGHGTHMAGIIAGDGTLSSGQWTGVAPRANLVSVKVAGADGSTDVSVVIAAMQWVVYHRAQYGIRVLNVSFGTDSLQSYLVDPLDFAVERVWASGILVVVAAGNRGPISDTIGLGTINKPADDPFVLTVGAADLKNTMDKNDDRIADFSSEGPTPDGVAKPDLVAPGITIVSVRDPGSTIDQAFPEAQVGQFYFKGTGTSQATAIVSGVAALMFQANPRLTPDVAKAALVGSSSRKLTGPSGATHGLVDAESAVLTAAWNLYAFRPANVGLTPGTGLGSLDASRGRFHVRADPDGDGQWQRIEGEIDVLGNAWSPDALSGNSWSTNTWAPYVSSDAGWTVSQWSGNSWSGTAWNGNSWSGNSWSGNSWSGNSWSGDSWSGDSWTSDSWS
jgi:serine protease AprX